MDPTNLNVREEIARMLNEQRLGVLSTWGKEYPYTSLVGFAVTRDLRRIVFATKRDTMKYRNIQAVPRATILIDSRANRTEDFEKAMTLSAFGEVHETADVERESLSGIFIEKHPYLEEFVASDGCALLKLEVVKYVMVTGFQKITEFNPNDE